MPDGVAPEFSTSELDAKGVKLRFQGEWMTCKKCGAKEKSHKDKLSNWTFVGVDDGGFYVCNRCYKTDVVQELLRDYLTTSENG